MSSRPQGGPRPNQGGQQGAQGPPEEIATAASNAKKIVQDIGPEGSKLLVEQAKRVGTFLRQQNLTTAQIRNIFGTVRSIESIWRLATLAKAGDVEKGRASREAMHELNLLKPRMAYAASRYSVVRHLENVLNPAIDAVLEDPTPEMALQRFGNFLDYFEAILAYHRSAGGR
jgi:CRISPR-associated protein Csm2